MLNKLELCKRVTSADAIKSPFPAEDCFRRRAGHYMTLHLSEMKMKFRGEGELDRCCQLKVNLTLLLVSWGPHRASIIQIPHQAQVFLFTQFQSVSVRGKDRCFRYCQCNLACKGLQRNPLKKPLKSATDFDNAYLASERDHRRNPF